MGISFEGIPVEVDKFYLSVNISKLSRMSNAKLEVDRSQFSIPKIFVDAIQVPPLTSSQELEVLSRYDSFNESNTLLDSFDDSHPLLDSFNETNPLLDTPAVSRIVAAIRVISGRSHQHMYRLRQ